MTRSIGNGSIPLSAGIKEFSLQIVVKDENRSEEKPREQVQPETLQDHHSKAEAERGDRRTYQLDFFKCNGASWQKLGQ
jgi:hypothetical protein